MKWNKHELEILIEYYGKIDNKELEKKLSRPIGGIYHKASRLGLKGNISLTNTKYDINHNFFTNINPISSYYAGFIAADGNISKNLCKVALSNKDLCILEDFRSHSGFNGQIYKCKDDCYRMSIASQKMISDLKNNFNITPQKSLTLQPPNLDYKHALCFIIGIIDGDGSIFLQKQKKDKNNSIVLSIINTRFILEWVKDIFGDVGTISYNMKNYHENTAKYRVTRKQAESLIWNMLSISELTDVRLKRKWDKIYELDKYSRAA